MSDNTQTIIMYRNPLEQAMWESVMSGGGQFVPIVTGGVVFLMVVIGMSVAFDHIYGAWTRPKWATHVAFIAGFVAWIAIARLMWQ
jgi:hypothetical protein